MRILGWETRPRAIIAVHMLHVLICMVADMVSRVLVKVLLRETRCLTQRQVVPSVHVQMSHVLVVLHVVKRPQMMDMYDVEGTRIMQTKLGMVIH